MLSNITLRGETSSLQLRYGNFHAPSGYVLEHVDGLDPAPGSIAITRYAVLPGGRYSSHTTEPRNIVLTVELQTIPGGPSVQRLRRDLVRAAIPGNEVRLDLWDSEEGRVTMYTTGYVETFEYDPFVKVPMASISILCPDPYLSGITWNDLGPFNRGSQTIDYLGDVATGVNVYVDLKRDDTTQVDIREVLSDSEFRGLTINDRDGDFRSTRTLWVNTRVGSKASFMRGSNSGTWLTSMMEFTASTEEWPMLLPGENEIRVNHTPFTSASDIQWGLQFRAKYGGF